ncbi:DegT/DnrJ/EryC1/StrS family aminotransferase [Xanthocytophaga agilis]|uniref:DegT/DnrJ/EryC1/StrS family aminotransferase n=1 Tax=Xanthocytophaga agilis TaxID=3048010 RepID=A0AAE3R2V3_9BACT|nr:DegT/DnrJ/EryC1/StrS family aminotransferase [Xanthocytophaga agilis]MDJ1502656.1 DegT/DnrJ/EryC1/StrS family aminotransferase [Xanthocytophaga agilis]
MINVTKAYLPPLEEYIEYLKGIWERVHLTNHGPLVIELEQRLKDYLGVKHLFFVNNGTIALQIAIKALDLKGKVITTPFSYVATTSSLVWENCEPIFVDIEPDYLCLNPDLIEHAITSDTSAILATHVYGNLCDVEVIEEIARRNNLKVIYDAAHAFGVKYKNTSVLNFGDISTLSFHATKIFHTVEGGAIVTNSDELADKISYMRNFGHNGQEAFWGVGINGKNSEFHAAMGLCVLPQFANILRSRKDMYEYYINALQEVNLKLLTIRNNTDYNYAYFPVIFSSEEDLLQVRKTLNEANIFPRRYFYPSLNNLPYLTYQATPIAEELSKKVLCLPFHTEITMEEINQITSLIKKTILC